MSVWWHDEMREWGKDKTNLRWDAFCYQTSIKGLLLRNYFEKKGGQSTAGYGDLEEVRLF